MKKTLKHLELFAGIGGFRKAIDLYCKDNNIKSECIGFSEIDKYATTTYKANYNTENEVELGDIGVFTSEKSNIERLPDFDLLSGGFPCQSFSMMGKQEGLEDKRGNLFYSIINILKIKKPKYVLLENVRNLRTHDNGRTFKEIIRSLEEDAGYFVSSDVFNTSDFGLPQTRRRIFIFGVRKDKGKKAQKNVSLDNDLVLEQTSSLNGSTSLKKYKNVLDNLLEELVEEKYYLSEKIKPTILSNGSKNFKSNSKINQLIARPLTATMVKMHRACQDNYYSDEFLTNENPVKYLENNFSKEEEAKHRIRKLTPLEALRLQGFEDNFCFNAQSVGISNHQLYKQAGNAVSVNTVYSILHYLFNKNLIKI
ncbi:DNA (cytosine-5-)-methyltransferase [Tenacibaculum finnmarkense genomovar ulcerans]|uniref:DNA (cytosine-5-)-methyltransferase n=1 Tax=Tenacibaculum finnmarkense TaxID=2781243 RepID=UPI001E40BBF6|nr:DNA (cytosine-5-)-methyltransferase [Tenacibaculum finnmarkense]MCD8431738.1 DNA (cytosine-5-)-methyltransferase [Tenacibaculum finnmarkense genomovar ulcerans]